MIFAVAAKPQLHRSTLGRIVTWELLRMRINRVLMHAIKAVHDNFENARVAEWKIRGDAAKISNAMQPVRNRCQQCKRPVAGIGDICECKTKTESERCHSNPRNTLACGAIGSYTSKGDSRRRAQARALRCTQTEVFPVNPCFILGLVR